jgi:hypothetical protein
MTTTGQLIACLSVSIITLRRKILTIDAASQDKGVCVCVCVCEDAEHASTTSTYLGFVTQANIPRCRYA